MNLRIAILTDGFFPNVIGGMQKHSYYLTKYLAAAGVKVDLYYPKFENAAVDLSAFSESETSNISFVPVAYPRKGGGFAHYIRSEYEFSRRIALAFEKRATVDFVIAKGFTAWHLLSKKSKGTSYPPIGVNFHGYEMFQHQPGIMAWLKSKLLFSSPVKFNVQHADYLFSYGGKITELIQKLNVQRKRIIEISTGISSWWLVLKAEQHVAPRRFVFVGRYERRKGVEELNTALRQLIAEKVNFSFEFVGAIPSGRKIASDKIFYHGKITDENALKEILCQSDVLVCPSYSEGMPNVIMEAMASGLAIITTNTGATGVMADESNGWIIEAGSADAVRNAMIQVINESDSALMTKRTNSIEKVQRSFLWEKVAQTTIGEIDRLVKSPIS